MTDLDNGRETKRLSSAVPATHAIDAGASHNAIHRAKERFEVIVYSIPKVITPRAKSQRHCHAHGDVDTK